MSESANWLLVFLAAAIPILLIYLIATGWNIVPAGMWGFVTNFGSPPDSKTKLLGPGPFFKLPWQTTYLYYITPQEVDVAKIKVSIGGETEEEAFVDATVFVSSEGTGVWLAPNHNPYQYAADLTYSAITAHLSGWGADQLFNADKNKVAKGITQQLQEDFSNLDTTVSVRIEDIDLPESVLAKSRLIIEAQGQAKASETLSRQEVENYRREKNLQGQDYMRREELDTLKATIIEAAKAGGLKALSFNLGSSKGGLDNAGTGYLVAREAGNDN